jgi:hypothetical protein
MEAQQKRKPLQRAAHSTKKKDYLYRASILQRRKEEQKTYYSS